MGRVSGAGRVGRERAGLAVCLWMQHMRGIGVTGTEVWVVEAMASARTTLAFQLASVSSEKDAL